MYHCNGAATKTKNKMNTEFNTIETIRTDSSIVMNQRSAAYLAACDQFEVQASKFANNENFIARKCANEVSLAYAAAKAADSEFTTYQAAHACEIWLQKAWNNAD